MKTLRVGSDNLATDNSAAEYRDGTGRRLTDYPRPSVAVDTALLTLAPGPSQTLGLAVLQVRRTGARGWALPGTFLHEGERLIDAVQRSLQEKAGVRGVQPRQLRVFDDPARDERGWVLSVAHVDLVGPELLSTRRTGQTRLASADGPMRLPYGHAGIVGLAVADVRARYATSPDPDGLLPGVFTLRELRLVHEAVAGYSWQRDNFRRAMQGNLLATGETASGTRGRPAEIFSRRTLPSG